MSKYSEQSPLEQQIRAMAEGFGGFPLPSTQLHIRGEALIPAHVVRRFHEMIGTFEAVRESEAKHQEAIEACTRALPEFRAFYADTVTVVKSHFGSDEKKLATFGLSSGKKAHRIPSRLSRAPREVVTTTVIEEVGGGREPSVEVIEVEEVIEEGGTRRGTRRVAKGAPAVTVSGATASPLPAPMTKPAAAGSKKKGGRR